MRNLLPKLLVLAATSLPIAAHAAPLDPIDNFILTDIAGDTITFSLPASPPVFGPSSPFLFETFPVLLSFNPAFFGNKNLDGQILFYSALGGGGLNVMISHPGGTTPIIDHGDLLYTGTTTDPTFLTGTFNVGSDTLTITPQAGPVPEPSTLVLLATDTLGVLCLARRVSPLIGSRLQNPHRPNLTLTPPPHERILIPQDQKKGISRCAKLSSPLSSFPLP